jgi:hypothetical protein
MIDPAKFYSEKDLPDSGTKKRLWNGISERLFASKRFRLFDFDRKSFLYGMAASFILMFTIVGIYSTTIYIAERSQPREIKTDRAYQTAIREFESVAFSVRKTSGSPMLDDLALQRQQRLTYLNGAIDELKEGLNSHDLSPLKRQRLRELYNLKLTLLQEMIQQGDIEL